MSRSNFNISSYQFRTEQVYSNFQHYQNKFQILDNATRKCKQQNWTQLRGIFSCTRICSTALLGFVYPMYKEIFHWIICVLYVC